MDKLWKRLSSLAKHLDDGDDFQEARRLRNIASQREFDADEREMAVELLDLYGY